MFDLVLIIFFFLKIFLNFSNRKHEHQEKLKDSEKKDDCVKIIKRDSEDFLLHIKKKRNFFDILKFKTLKIRKKEEK